jgi:hypothetical protein
MEQKKIHIVEYYKYGQKKRATFLGRTTRTGLMRNSMEFGEIIMRLDIERQEMIAWVARSMFRLEMKIAFFMLINNIVWAVILHLILGGTNAK